MKSIEKRIGLSVLCVAATAMLALTPAIQADDSSIPGATQARPTFTRDVQPLLQEKCVDCHRPEGLNMGGMVAPMSLMTFEEARPWAKSMAKVVKNREMPPWHANADQHGVFDNERTLTDTQIETIVRWAASGAPRGDLADAPPAKVFDNYEGWSLGKPDLVIGFDEPYWVADDVEDLYVNIPVKLTEEQLPVDRWIRAAEFRAGGKWVHHIIARPIGGIAPGYEARVMRPGYSRKLKAGSEIDFKMHYHKEPGEGTGAWDSSEVAVYFWPKGTVIEHIKITEALPARGFMIPAGDGNYSHGGSYTFAEDSEILSFNPHMHLRGKAARMIATFPDGSQKVLLDVPKYDFNWQTTYHFKEPVHVPAGTKIDMTLWWDNSAENPANPDPTVDVVFGRPTTAEMGFGWMHHTATKPIHIVVGEEDASSADAPGNMGGGQ